jgi:arginase family enzyme
MKTLVSTVALLALLPIAAVAQNFGAADTPDEIDMIDEGVEPVIRLNPEDPTFDIWKKIRSDISDGREPGPINVQRFVGGTPWEGIPTFFHLPIALTPEDLKAGEVEVAIFGAELIGDMRARSYGPQEMRNPHRSEVYRNWGAFAMPELDTGLTWSHDLTVVDYGDAPTHPMSIDLTIPEVRKFVASVAGVELENGKRTIPIIIGGGHALMYPDAIGLTDVYGKGNLQIIHFDAHADQAPVGFGFAVTHGNPVRKLVEGGYVNGEDIIQVGLRGPNSTDLSGVAWNRTNGLRYHMMSEIEVRGWQAVMDDVLAEAKANGKPTFISFDVDVIDPAFVAGTSTPEPGGLYMREALPLMRRLCAESNVVGVELVELRPDSDPGYTTMLNVKSLLRQCLNGFAVSKAGLGDNYYDPTIIDDGK